MYSKHFIATENNSLDGKMPASIGILENLETIDLSK